MLLEHYIFEKNVDGFIVTMRICFITRISLLCEFISSHHYMNLSLILFFLYKSPFSLAISHFIFFSISFLKSFFLNSFLFLLTFFCYFSFCFYNIIINTFFFFVIFLDSLLFYWLSFVSFLLIFYNSIINTFFWLYNIFDYLSNLFLLYQ